MTKLVYGVGINDGKYPAKLNGKIIKEYKLWLGLLKRCYSPIYHRENPTYISCKASENFKNYSYFYEWCQTQIGFNKESYHLDKDLIFKGNKLYSENTCLFVPSQLNRILMSSGACRGNLPLGVTLEGSKFKARCWGYSPKRHIGTFDTIEEAFNAYKAVKEAFIKAQAEKWKAHIDPRAFVALIAYEVSISD